MIKHQDHSSESRNRSIVAMIGLLLPIGAILAHSLVAADNIGQSAAVSSLKIAGPPSREVRRAHFPSIGRSQNGIEELG